MLFIFSAHLNSHQPPLKCPASLQPCGASAFSIRQQRTGEIFPCTTSVPCPLAWGFQKCKCLVVALGMDSSRTAVYLSPGAVEELPWHRPWHTSRGGSGPFVVLPAHQAPPSLGFSRQEHWSGLPLPSPMHESEKWKWSRSVVPDF